MQRLRATGL